MGFIIIYTPRTGSRRPAVIIPPGQAKNRGVLLDLGRHASEVAVGSRKRGVAEPAWRPIILPNAVGVSLPVITSSGATAPEIYLFAGVNAKALSKTELFDIQARLISQTVGMAETLITSGIPWAQRRAGSGQHRNQFASQDVVLRAEMDAYTLLFPELPSTDKFSLGLRSKRNRMMIWSIFLIIPALGVAAYFYKKVLDAPKPEEPAARKSTLSAPAEPEIPAPPAPIVMPNPYGAQTLDQLRETLKEMREMRAALMQEKTEVYDTPEGRMGWEQRVIRFNRRREQLLAAFNRFNVEVGQSSLDDIFLDEYVDNIQSPTRMRQTREELMLIRSELGSRRSTINVNDLAQVEDYNDKVEWFNFRVTSFNKAGQYLRQQVIDDKQ